MTSIRIRAGCDSPGKGDAQFLQTFFLYVRVQRKIKLGTYYIILFYYIYYIILCEGYPRWCSVVRVPAQSCCVDGPSHITIEYTTGCNPERSFMMSHGPNAVEG
jgi:hypothetical protein